MVIPECFLLTIFLSTWCAIEVVYYKQSMIRQVRNFCMLDCGLGHRTLGEGNVSNALGQEAALQPSIPCVCRYAAATAHVELPIDPVKIILIKQRFLSLALFMSLEDFISGWFLGAPASEIKRKNVEEFVAYSMYCRKHESLSLEVASFSHEPKKPDSNPQKQVSTIQLSSFAHLFTDTVVIFSSANYCYSARRKRSIRVKLLTSCKPFAIDTEGGRRLCGHCGEDMESTISGWL